MPNALHGLSRGMLGPAPLYPPGAVVPEEGLGREGAVGGGTCCAGESQVPRVSVFLYFPERPSF